MKVCFKCNIEKPLSEFYKHKEMGDGHLGKCKQCTKSDTKEHDQKLRLVNPDYIESEKTRHREKYYRLDYKNKHKPSAINKKTICEKYKQMYPEKSIVKNISVRLKPITKGNHLHHWSYNREHAKDVIEMPTKEHYKLHRYIIYDQERFMYRRCDNLELLDTKEKHLEYYNSLKDKV